MRIKVAMCGGLKKTESRLYNCNKVFKAAIVDIKFAFNDAFPAITCTSCLFLSEFNQMFPIQSSSLLQSIHAR